MFNLFTPPCFAAIGAMNSEMKSSKWLWGGIGLQLGVGYTIGYLVYTVGTLIVDPKSLAIIPAICGLAAVLVFAGIIGYLISKANKNPASKQTLNGKKNDKAAVKSFGR